VNFTIKVAQILHQNSYCMCYLKRNLFAKLFPLWMSVTIIFLTYSNYTSQSIAVVTTAIFIPVYLFIARQSRHHMSAPKFNQLYLRHF